MTEAAAGQAPQRARRLGLRQLTLPEKEGLARAQERERPGWGGLSFVCSVSRTPPPLQPSGCPTKYNKGAGYKASVLWL